MFTQGKEYDILCEMIYIFGIDNLLSSSEDTQQLEKEYNYLKRAFNDVYKNNKKINDFRRTKIPNRKSKYS